MDVNYDAIYLSPHLDDVALSCGGQIFLQTQRGQRVLVVTIAAGEPQTNIRSTFAEFLHHNWGFSASEAVAMRRAEDDAACAHLGAEAMHWHLPDAIYRLHPQSDAPLYTSDEDIFGPVHCSEDGLVDDIARFLTSLPAATRVVAPLAIGNHVDHQLVHAAAARVWQTDLLYYEDYPYVQRHPQELARRTQPASAWRSYLIPLTHAALSARLAATRAYTSQLSSLFNDDADLEASIRAQVAQTGGERLWQQAIVPTRYGQIGRRV